MKFSHITRNAKGIKENGFSLSFTGSQGGNQMGDGIYLSQHPETWKQVLGMWDAEVIEVEVKMEKIFNLENFSHSEFDPWAETNGWLDAGGPMAKFDELIEKLNGQWNDALWHLKAEFIKAQGFSGMWDTEFHNLVIWNLEAITI